MELGEEIAGGRVKSRGKSVECWGAPLTSRLEKQRRRFQMSFLLTRVKRLEELGVLGGEAEMRAIEEIQRCQRKSLIDTIKKMNL